MKRGSFLLKEDCDLISIILFQLLTAGQGLNDDLWHTLRFSRRFNSLKFQIDNEGAIRGMYIHTSEMVSLYLR